MDYVRIFHDSFARVSTLVSADNVFFKRFYDN